jgi:hypothetical protein
MPTDARAKVFLATFVSPTFALLILTRTAQEALARASGVTVPTGPVTKGPVMSGTGTCAACGRVGPVQKGPTISWCVQHPSAPICRGARYPCNCWACPACPPVRRLP